MRNLRVCFVVCVTNLPSAFLAARPHIRQFKKVRLALGLHPLNVELHTDAELTRFKELVDRTSFIVEIGLDFSRQGYATKDRQLHSFRFVLQSLRNQPKFVTIHSRRAENAVLELLQQEYAHPVVFHWYSGSLKTLETVIGRGHFFSINPAMVRNDKTLETVAKIPRDRILTESDGPFIEMGERATEPKDVRLVEESLGKMWEMNAVDARNIVRKNFQDLIAPLRQPAETGSIRN
jgi:TatD DNase family protein